MIRYFYGSISVTILGFTFAYFWAAHSHSSGWAALFAVFFLSILEVTLSFDNAIVNAQKLKNMSLIWRKRFLTWGILIAVFGTRLLFPILFVSIFANIGLWDVLMLAIYDVDKYTLALYEIHAPLISFGGAFMMMLCLDFFMKPERHEDSVWISVIERPFSKLGRFKVFPTLITFMTLLITYHMVKPEERTEVMISGIAGIILFIAINFAINFAIGRAEKKQAADGVKGAVQTGFLGFMYLEAIDASFSLDGVLSAFAITKDIIIMAVGLAIGAMFVRSFTVYMVEKNTLQKFVHLESGAHWAVGSLAIIMFYSAFAHVSEIAAGGIAFVIIVCAFVSSMKYNKKLERSSKSSQ